MDPIGLIALRKLLQRLLPIVALAVLTYGSAHATAYTWNGSANGNTTGGWSANGAWNPSGVPTTGDTITFDGTGSPSSTVTLGSNQAIGGIIINSGATGSTTITSGGVPFFALTIGSGGITQAASTGTVTLGSASMADNYVIELGASQTWSNAGSNPLLIYAGINGTASSGTQTLTTSGSGSIALAGAIGDSISGTGVVALSAGAGTTILSGGNSYSGKTTASSGTLQFNGSSAMSGNSALSLGNGATLALRSDTADTFVPASVAIQGAAGSTSTVTIDVNHLTTGTSNTLTLTGTLGLVTNSNAVINVTGGNGYTAAISGINEGTSELGHTWTINATSANLNAGVLTFGSYGVTANLDGTGSITIANLNQGSNSPNAVNIGTGSDSPTVTIQGATTSINNRQGGSLSFTLNSGKFNMNNASVMSNAGGSGYNVTLTINGGTLDNTSGAAITEIGSGTLTLAGNFAFSTAAGTASNSLYLQGATVIDNQAALTITLNGGGTLGLGYGVLQNGSGGNQTLTVNNGSGTTASTALQLSGYTLSATSGVSRTDTINGSGNVLIAGQISNGSGTSTPSGLTYAGTGTLFLTGSNIYTGTTTISSGAVELGTGGGTGTLSSSSAIVDNGNLIFNRNNAVVQGTDFSTAAITGTGSVTQAGSGTTTLNVANTYAGGTYITAGQITANVAGTSSSSGSSLGVGTSTVTISGGRLLIGSTASSNATWTAYNPVALNGGVLQANDGIVHLAGPVTLNGGTLAGSFNDSGGGSRKGLWIDGSISGSGNVAVNYIDGSTAAYAGTMVRITSSGNTYSGTMTVDGNGSLNNGGNFLFLDSSSALPDATINLSGSNSGTNLQFANGTLIFGTSVTSETINGLAGNGNFALQNVSGTPAAVALTVGGAVGSTAVSTTYSGVMSGSGSLTKAGSGTLTLAGATGNTYAGKTAVNAGGLIITNGSNSATGTGSLTVSNSATFGGTGRYSGSGFNVTGTGTATGSRATVLAGMTSAADTNTTGVLTMLGSATSTITNANLTFNLNALVAGSLNGNPAGSGTELNVGATKVGFGTGIAAVSLTLNIENETGTAIAPNTPYVLIAGTLATGGGGVNGSQYQGLTLGSTIVNANGVTETRITGANLQLLFGSSTDQSWYGTNSYLVLYQDTVNNIDDIDVVVVPEPGTWAMMLGGLGLLLFWQRRKSRR